MTEKSKPPVGEVIWPLMAEFVRGRSWDANLTPNAVTVCPRMDCSKQVKIPKISF